MSDCFSDIEGALVIFDDILITGKTRESHNRCLEEVLKRTKKFGINLNSQLRKKQIQCERSAFYWPYTPRTNKKLTNTDGCCK